MYQSRDPRKLTYKTQMAVVVLLNTFATRETEMDGSPKHRFAITNDIRSAET